MAEKTYNLLKENMHRFVSINGSTQIRAGVIRPEILIPFEENLKNSNKIEELDMAISENSQVRVIREPFFGKVGKVINLPTELSQMQSETLVRVAEIEFEDGSVEIIPRANLEMILL